VEKYYYTYVLLSKRDSKFYIGWTDNLKERVEKHNKGLVRSTKSRKPFKLIYFEACLSKQKAVKREKALKTGFGRAFLSKRI